MTHKPFEDLPPFAQDALGNDARDDELLKTAEALAAVGTLANPTPSESGRARLVAAVSSGPERYGPFFSKLSRMVDLGIDRIQAIIAESADPKRWESGPLPGLTLFHFQGGPAVASLDTGLIRVDAGLVFPEHTHLGRELVLLLEGQYRETTGRIYGPGDFHDMATGTTHGYTVLDKPVLLATVIDGGIDIAGRKITG